MSLFPSVCLTPGDARWPSLRPGASVPTRLFACGNLDLLKLPKTALFCSARCPGEAILRAHDQAARWCDEGRCIIGGFHSPVERECLRILLRGDAPVILCPARGPLERLPAPQAVAVAGGRLLFLSCFPPEVTRVTAELATRRNEFVAALADDVWFAHINPGGQMERLVRETPATEPGGDDGRPSPRSRGSAAALSCHPAHTVTGPRV